MSMPTSAPLAPLRTSPSIDWPAPPEGLDPDRLVWAETVRGGGYTHLVLPRGTTLRLTDLDGDACAHVLAYNADLPGEWLDVADTVELQGQENLTAGCLLVSDRGRALATIVGNTSQRHDTIFAATSGRPPQPASPRSGTPAGHELLAHAAAKHELGRRDIPPSIALFQGVCVDDDGAACFLGSAGPGASVTIRAELALVVLLANAAHPLDPRPAPTCGRLEALAWRDRPIAPDDPRRAGSSARRRAYARAAAYVSAGEHRGR